MIKIPYALKYANKPLLALGISMAAFAVFLLWSVAAVAQEVEGEVSFTAQGQGYWTVMVDGEQVSQHTTEREAYESATNEMFISAGNAEVQVLHNAVIDVDLFVEYIPVVEPEPEPDPIPPAPGTIEIPGVDSWTPSPEFGVVHRFRVLNDDWAVTSDNQWLYAFKIIDAEVAEGWVVNRPNGWYRSNPTQSETTPLEVGQVINLITAMAYD